MPAADCQLEFGPHEHASEEDVRRCEAILRNMLHPGSPEPTAWERERAYEQGLGHSFS